MQIPLSAYVVVVLVGTLCMVLLSYLEPMRSWRRAFLSEPIFSIPVTLIWLLLMWPQEHDEAYFVGSELGIMRIARIVVFGLLAFVLVANLLNRNQFAPGSLLGSYFLYIVVCFLSAIYSSNVFETVWKAFELLVLLLWALELFIRSDGDLEYGRTLMRGMLFSVFVIVLFGLVSIVVYPELSYYSLYEITQDTVASAGSIVPRVYPNTLTQMAGIVLVVGLIAFFDDPETRMGSVILLLIGIVVMAASHSRTSILAAVMIVTFIMLRRKTRVLILSVLAVVVVFGLVSSVLPAIEEFIYRGQTQTQFFSMTGRTILWATGWEAFVDAPWLGHGFYAGHKTLAPLTPIENLSSLDNMYLESLVNVGIIGTCFLFYFSIKLLVGTIRMDNQEDLVGSGWARWERSVPFVLAGFVLVRAITGPSFQVLHPNLSIVFVSMVVVAIWQSNLDGPQYVEKAEEGQPDSRDSTAPLDFPYLPER